MQTIRSSVNDSRWVEISFSCYNLNSWTGNDLKTGEQQAWLWAFNTVQSFNEATEESSLAAHDHYGYFSLTMTDHNIGDEMDGSIIPHIDPSLPNQGTDNSGSEDKKSPRNWVKTHGSLLILGLMILYPSGALTIRSSSKYSFKGHLFFQSLASIFCLVGGVIAFCFVDLTLAVSENLQELILHRSETSLLSYILDQFAYCTACADRHGGHPSDPTAISAGIFAPQSLLVIARMPHIDEEPCMYWKTACPWRLRQFDSVCAMPSMQLFKT